MTKKKTKTKVDEKILTKEEVAKFKPTDKTTEIEDVMSFGLKSAYDLGVAEGATVVKRTSPEVKAGNVDKLPK